MENALEIQGLYVYYGNVCALENINITIKQNEFLGIIGPNGGGKTTLLKVILGLLKPSKGTVNIFGVPPQKGNRFAGYVPQFMKFDKHFPINVMDTVLMGRLSAHEGLIRRYSNYDKEIAQSFMHKLEIYDLRKRQIGQLSGGQLQRVLIARALTSEPRILLLDEPTASVDSMYKMQIYEILKQINKDIAVVIVTHDLGVVSSYVKTVACLNRTMYYHGDAEINDNIVEKMYGCPIDLIGHGIPHRVLREHGGDNRD